MYAVGEGASTLRFFYAFFNSFASACARVMMVVLYVDATWPCGWISADSMHHHLTHECINRLVTCPNGCGQRVPGGATLASHLSTMCSMRTSKGCPQGCGAEFRECDLASHLEHSCVKREVLCPTCGDRVVLQDMEEHQAQVGPGGCRAKLLRCPWGCGALVRQEELDCHCKGGCPKRYVTCPMCHNDRVWAEEMEDAHPHRECPERQVVCPHEHCGNQMVAKYLEEHVASICAFRLVRCECGIDVHAGELELHRHTDCRASLRYCTLGCGMMVREIAMS